jgi:hypothetical protein
VTRRVDPDVDQLWTDSNELVNMASPERDLLTACPPDGANDDQWRRTLPGPGHDVLIPPRAG